MKFSISNIGWPKELDQDVFALLQTLGYTGIEIAPTRTFDNGYDVDESSILPYLNHIETYGLSLCSMQSLLFGITQPIFKTENGADSVNLILDKAMVFSSKLDIPNWVFGSPVIRSVDSENDLQNSKVFFEKLASKLQHHSIKLSIEPNPVIYKTNFLTTTEEALSYVEQLNVPNLGINLDLGTVIYNLENLDQLITENTISFINHVHISEPYLVPIDQNHHAIHLLLLSKLKEHNYDHYVSIEMKSREDIKEIESILRYIKDVAIEAGVWNGN